MNSKFLMCFLSVFYLKENASLITKCDLIRENRISNLRGLMTKRHVIFQSVHLQPCFDHRTPWMGLHCNVTLDIIAYCMLHTVCYTLNNHSVINLIDPLLNSTKNKDELLTNGLYLKTMVIIYCWELKLVPQTSYSI